MKNTVVILRGPSGSGKSTWIKDKYYGEQYDDRIVAICSADSFFVDNQTGEYKFDIYKLGQAHAACLAQFVHVCAGPIEIVIVDNTNIHNWEWTNYELIARALGREVKIVEFRVTTIKQLKLCQQRNTHGVDPATVARMIYEFEPSISTTEIVDVK